MPDFDNTPPQAKDLSAPHDNTAPGSMDLSAAPSNVEPGAVTVDLAQSNVAAVDKAIAGVTPDNGAPEAVDMTLTPSNTPAVEKTLSGITPDDTAPAAVDLTTPATPNNAAAVPITDTPISSLTMPASFAPAFVELTGGGNCLDTLMATAADLGKILQGTVGGELKSYQVRAHAGAADLPGIVLPANHDPVTNAVAFFQAGL